MAEIKVRQLTRDKLAKFLPNLEAIKAFEEVLVSVGQSLPAAINENGNDAANAFAAAAQALSDLSQIAGELAYCLAAPLHAPGEPADDLAPPVTVAAVHDDVAPPVLPQVASDDFAPPVAPASESDDLTPRAQLGTVSAQNADNVEITGGSISGMTKNDATGVTLADDTTTNATMYPVFGTGTGTQSPKISTTKLTWNPSTGLFSAPSFSGQFNGTLGLTTPAAAAVTTLAASGQITSTVSTGTAPFSISSTTVVPNLNVSLLLGATWAAPGAIGSGTPGSGAFTTLSASSNVGVNASPSAWASSYRAVALNHTGTNAYGWSGGNLCGLVTGAYIDTGFAWRYAVSSLAINKIELNDSGNVTIATAPAGTSGNAVTWTNRLTVTPTGVTVKDAFGCNGKTAQTSAAVGAAATDLASVITLANNIRTALINNGIAS